MNNDRDSLLRNGDPGLLPDRQNYDNIETQAADHQDHTGPAPNKCRQILAGITATLSALSAGVVLGWTSPILTELTGGKYNNIRINDDQMGWIGSFATLGAMAMCIPTGFVCDLIGRKRALLSLILPFVVGWGLILWAENVLDLYFGRLIAGMAVGACCIAAPLYNGEIAHKSVRGALGSCFQLMVVTGIFIAYLFGKFLTPCQFTIFCAMLPFVFFVAFLFQPESPVYLVQRGRYDDAKNALIVLRGEHYDVDAELNEIEGALKENSQSAISFAQMFSRKSVRKAAFISFALMFFQQFSGINAIILYSSDIIKSTGVSLDPNTATIMVGGFQAVATLLASLLIDKLGRKFLLTVSLTVLAINALLLAVYFSLKTRTDIDATILAEIGFVPVGAMCLYVIAFSLGLGPIPWMISSEIFPAEIRSLIGSMAGTYNWLLAFILTKFYLQVCHATGTDSAFYVFSAISALGIIFVMVFIPETKGKSVSEIQEELDR